MPDQPPEERQMVNITVMPEVMAGHYANYAQVTHSPYEFTITFARVDHAVEGASEVLQGIVVSRINLSPRFARELIGALEDQYSRWQAREGIQNLPEFKGELGNGEG